MQGKNIINKKILVSLKNIGNNLQKLRNKSGLTQKELSFKIYLSERTYQYIESAKLQDIKFSTIFKILDYFDITFEELIK